VDLSARRPPTGGQEGKNWRNSSRLRPRPALPRRRFSSAIIPYLSETKGTHTRVPKNSEALKLIPLIYEAAEDSTLWPEVLNQIGALLGAGAKVFSMEDLREGKSTMALAVGIDPAYQRLYDEHYESVNIHIQRARPLLIPGRVIATHQFCSDEETLASEYYQGFLRPQDGFTSLAAALPKTEVCYRLSISYEGAGPGTSPIERCSFSRT
jgi:hypothetical protein